MASTQNGYVAPIMVKGSVNGSGGPARVLDQASIEQGIRKIMDWIKGPGNKLLASQNSIPQNLEGAEKLRKAHEQFEFKCTECIGFYAELAELPRRESTDDPLYALDIEVQEFLQRLHQRRAIVVSCFTFFRLLEELWEKLRALLQLCSEEMQLDDGNKSGFDKKIKERLDQLERILKAIGVKKESLRHERQRLRVLLGERLPENLEEAVRKAWTEMANVEQVASLRQLEWRKEAQLAQCRTEAERTISWLAGLSIVLYNSYRDSCVGKTPVETSELLQEQDKLQRKAEEAYQFTDRLLKALQQMCQNERRSTRMAEELNNQLQLAWQPFQMQQRELRERREVAETVYKHVDAILSRVESLLLTLANAMEQRDAKDSAASTPRNSFIQRQGAGNSNSLTQKEGQRVWLQLVQKHSLEREDIIEDYEETAKIAAALMQRLTVPLDQRKAGTEPGSPEVESTQAILRMKLYTLWIKIMELEDYLGKRKDTKTTRRTVTTTEFTEIDTTIKITIDKFLEAMSMYEKRWRFGKLPRNLVECNGLMQQHADCQRDVAQQWQQVQSLLQPLAATVPQAKDLLQQAGDRLQQWQAAWSAHQQRLDMRKSILVRMDEWDREVQKPRSAGLAQSLQEVAWGDGPSVEKFNGQIKKWISELPPLDRRLEELLRDIRNNAATIPGAIVSSNEENDDFINDPAVVSMTDKWVDYKRLLQPVQRLLEEVVPLHQGLIKEVDRFNVAWPTRYELVKGKKDPDAVYQLADEIQNLQEKLDQVNDMKLKQITKDIYGQEDPIVPIFRRLHPHPFNDQQLLDQVLVQASMVPALEQRRANVTRSAHRRLPDEPDSVVPTKATPQFTKPLENQRAKPSTKATFHCQVSQPPDVPLKESNVSWAWEGVPLTQDNMGAAGIQTKTEPRGDCYLEIPYVTKDHEGQYECTVTNDRQQTASTSATLEVEESKLRLLKPLDAPGQVPAGGEIHLLAQYEGYPPPEVTWYKDNKPILPDGSRVDVKTDDKESHLRVYPVRPADGGFYAVEIRNPTGSDGSVVTIQVPEVQKPPAFAHGKGLEDQHVNENDRVFFRAELSEAPKPSDNLRVQWFKDNAPITPKTNPNYQTSMLGPELRLTIAQAVPDDEGLFKVAVENEAGHVESQGYLQVEPGDDEIIGASKTRGNRSKKVGRAATHELEVEHGQTQNLALQRTSMVFSNTVVRSPPEFLQLFADEICTPGEAVIFTALVAGLPKPAVWWSYNGQFLMPESDRGSRCEFQESEENGGTRYSLVLTRVTEADAGRYSLTAENSTGLATCSSLLLVLAANSHEPTLTASNTLRGLQSAALSAAASRYNTLSGRSTSVGTRVPPSVLSLSTSRPLTPTAGLAASVAMTTPLSAHTHLSYASNATANDPATHVVQVASRLETLQTNGESGSKVPSQFSRKTVNVGGRGTTKDEVMFASHHAPQPQRLDGRLLNTAPFIDISPWLPIDLQQSTVSKSVNRTTLEIRQTVTSSHNSTNPFLNSTSNSASPAAAYNQSANTIHQLISQDSLEAENKSGGLGEDVKEGVTPNKSTVTRNGRTQIVYDNNPKDPRRFSVVESSEYDSQ